MGSWTALESDSETPPCPLHLQFLQLLRARHAFRQRSLPGGIRSLFDRANRSVECKRRWNCVGGSVPGAVEADAAIAAANRDAAVVARVRDRYFCATLGFRAVPETGDGLAVGKRPCQCPAADGGGACVCDGDRRSKGSQVLWRDPIVNLAGGR